MVHLSHPETWPDDDLIGVSTRFDPEVVVDAYRAGAFPMPLHGRYMGWFSPVLRGVLPLDGLRVTRSLRKSARHYRVTVDTAFERVLARCGDPRREHGWIDADIAEVYSTLHQRGYVHSVEAWAPDGQLAGGLYGVSVGGLFAGESMFHDPEIGRDASKVALIELVRRLTADGVRGRVLDVQWRTDHLASLGVVEIERWDYLNRLDRALQLPPPDWAPGTD